MNSPIKPIDEYCAALEAWSVAVHENPALSELAVHIDAVFLAIRKSALLLRLLYDGGVVRTEKCPHHKGRWSGCGWGRIECINETYPQGCYSGNNISGWLPDEAERLEQMKWHTEHDFPMLKAEPQRTTWSESEAKP